MKERGPGTEPPKAFVVEDFSRDMKEWDRRQFLQSAAALALAAAVSAALPLCAAEKQIATARHLPRWRGFNLLDKYVKRRGGNPAFQESDFALLSEWGFDFARLPMSYLCWTEPEDWLKLNEQELKDIDQAVEFGRKHGIHINLNLHRAPGYCVNPPKEPLDLWSDQKALDACAFHWAHFAKRYKGIPRDQLSFDLLNEPARIPEDTYVRVVKRLVQAQPKNPRAWINLAVANFTRERYTDGIDACRKALACDGDSLVAIFNLALAHEHLRKYDEAMDWTRHGLSKEPKDVSLQKMELRLRVLQLRSRAAAALKWCVGRRG